MTEAVLVLALMAPAVSAVLSTIYLSTAYVWIDHCVYESLICLSTPSPTQFCKETLKTRVNAALPIGRLTKTKLTRSSTKASAHVSFAIHQLNLIQIRNQLNLPLRADLTGRRRIF